MNKDDKYGAVMTQELTSLRSDPGTVESIAHLEELSILGRRIAARMGIGSVEACFGLIVHLLEQDSPLYRAPKSERPSKKG